MKPTGFASCPLSKINKNRKKNPLNATTGKRIFLCEPQPKKKKEANSLLLSIFLSLHFALGFHILCNNEALSSKSRKILARYKIKMYGSTAKRLLQHFGGPLVGCSGTHMIRFRPLQSLVSRSHFSTTVNSEPFANKPPSFANSTSSYADEFPNISNSSSSTVDHTRRSRVEYQDEQARVLQASLPHVIRLGWSEAAMIAGAKDVGVSPSIVGSFPRKEGMLVEFFMDDCLQRLIDRIESSADELKSLIPSDRITKLIRIRLEMQAPYISKWPPALSIQAQPVNVPTSFKQRAMLVDEIWHGAGDDTADFQWYVKRTVLGGIYSTTEIYMLTDNSPDFRDTWAFLDDRVKDAFDLKKTIQEATYLAEAVGAGMGTSLQGFVKRVFQG